MCEHNKDLLFTRTLKLLSSSISVEKDRNKLN